MFPLNENGNVDFTRLLLQGPDIRETTVVPLPAVAEGLAFRAQRRNVIKALEQARKDVNVPYPLKSFLVVFGKRRHLEVGINAQLLKELMRTASDDLVRFELSEEDSKVILSHGNTRQEVNLRDRFYFVDSKKKEYIKHLVFFNLDGQVTESEPGKRKYDAWIGKAVSKRVVEGGEFMNVHWGTFAMDGYRIHYREDQKFYQDSLFPLAEERLDTILRMMEEARVFPKVAHVSPVDLEKAVRTARAANGNTIHMKFTKAEVKVWGHHVEDGDTGNSVYSGYTFKGKRSLVLIDPKFLLQALEGMRAAADITIRINDKNQRMYITDGTREVVIMLKIDAQKGRKK